MESISFQILADLGLIFGVAVLLALAFMRFHLPAVLAYLGAGLVLGPSGFGLVERTEELSLLAELGVVLLLFTVGLEFSLSEARNSWRAVLLGGGLQVTITTLAVVALLVVGHMWSDGQMGAGWRKAWTWGFLLAPSSTAVVLRLLDTRRETRAAHGRLVLGILIFQDLCVVPMMLMLPILAGEHPEQAAGKVVLHGLILVLILAFSSVFVVPRLLRHAAASRNREVFLLAVLAIAGLTAYATSLTGLSLALGAFFAGIVLSETQYAHQAMADVLPLRAMTMCVFFVTIGMLFDVELVLARPQLVLILSTFILLGKAGVVFLVGVLLRSPPRVAMLAGLALAQVGEFSFVLSGVAVDVGLLTPKEEGLLLAASIVSIAVTPLALSFFPRMLAGSRLLEPLQRRLEGRSMPTGVETQEPLRDHVVVVGLGVGGRAVVEAVEQIGMVPLIIELNPATVAFERARGRHILFGDSTSQEVLQHAGVRRAKAVVLVLSDAQAAHRTAELMHNMAPHIPVILRTRYVDEEGAERAIGAEVHSEEFAGAMAIVSAVLRQCQAVDAEQVCDNLTRSHEQLAAADEGALGPPPQSGIHSPQESD